MNPLEEYRARLESHRLTLKGLERQFRLIGNTRLGVGVIGVGVAFVVFGEVWISAWWLVVPLAAFAALVVMHSRVVERMQRAQRAIQFYERGLARLEDRWIGTGEAGERFRNPEHVYSEDLDLFGKGSLFELISIARTRAGEESLASWLLGPGTRAAVETRQEAVKELKDRLDLREDLAVLGATVRSGLDPDAVERWGEAPEVLFPRGSQYIAPVIAAAVVILFVLYMAGVWSRTPFLGALLVEIGYLSLLGSRTLRVASAVNSPAHDLALLSELLERLERETFRAPVLEEVLATLKPGNMTTASTEIRRLGQLVARLDWQRNVFFAPIALALLWAPQVAMAMERWRKRCGGQIRTWINAVGEFEALNSLGGYSYEHPEDVFPELVDEQRGWFEADALAHPLMAAGHAIPNDVRLGGETRLWIVSGSNMSGKSTLLRTIGTNAVLAWAGAPVRAARLKISAFALGASIRVQDSLQDGRSRFYAEITRLRQVVALTGGDRPVLFLLDELLSGTNSHDRRIGAAAIVKALIDHGAIGLITTHDLALAHIADTLGGHAINVHFADTLRYGQLIFDYRLQPGVVERSNALDLMRSVGLEV